MTTRQTFMGNPFDPLGDVVIVGFSGARRVDIGGPLKLHSPCVYEGDGFLFNSRGVQVTERGELVRPPVVMAINRVA